MSIEIKLLTILPKIAILGISHFKELLKEFPDAVTRSTVLTLYDERSKFGFYIGFENNKPVVKSVDLRNPPLATTEITMHVDTFIAILKNKLDFRTAYIHDLIDIKSNDGLPPTYHLILWSAFFDKVAEILK
jgi:hypothetical protein